MQKVATTTRPSDEKHHRPDARTTRPASRAPNRKHTANGDKPGTDANCKYSKQTSKSIENENNSTANQIERSIYTDARGLLMLSVASRARRARYYARTAGHCKCKTHQKLTPASDAEPDKKSTDAGTQKDNPKIALLASTATRFWEPERFQKVMAKVYLQTALARWPAASANALEN